jgi:hypothetical protein
MRGDDMDQLQLFNHLRYWSFHELYGLRGTRLGNSLLQAWCIYQTQYVPLEEAGFTTVETLETRLADGIVGVFAFDRIQRAVVAHSVGCLILTTIEGDRVEAYFGETDRFVVFESVTQTRIRLVFKEFRKHVQKTVLAHYFTHGFLTTPPDFYFYHQNRPLHIKISLFGQRM